MGLIIKEAFLMSRGSNPPFGLNLLSGFFMKLIDWINQKDHNYAEDLFSDRIHSLTIVKEFSSHKKGFPQKKNTHRNIHCWVLLEDGSAIGLNESPRSGFSFPRIGQRTVKSIYPEL